MLFSMSHLLDAAARMLIKTVSFAASPDIGTLSTKPAKGPPYFGFRLFPDKKNGIVTGLIASLLLRWTRRG